MSSSEQMSSVTGIPSDEDQCPLQLIQFVQKDGGTTIELQQEVLDAICSKIGDLPICVIDVCGPSRQGKSFLLGYVIRRLVGLENGQRDDWMGWQDMEQPLKGFTFRNGRAPETQGIWIWSRPFIVKTSEGKDIAILLLDTQGTNDEFTSSKDMATIVGLSLLMSSITIFNFFTNLQEDILLALNTYIEYGNLALDEEDSHGPPFQNLTFLIRDFNNPDEFPYGSEGGKLFLEDTLRVKKKHSDEAKHVREKVRNCFRDLSCFLMPSIGEKAKFRAFTGSIAEVEKEFAKKLEEFINNLVSPGNILVKTLLENPVHASELKSLLTTYINVFSSDEVPSAGSMWQATAQLSNQHVLEKSMQKYRDFIKAEVDDCPYLSKAALETTQLQGELEAMNWFKKSRKIGSPQLVLEFEEKLSDEIGRAFDELKEENGRRQEVYITAVTLETSNEFRAKLEQEFPFPVQTAFYNEIQIKDAAENQKPLLIKSFEDKLVREEADKLVNYVRQVADSFTEIIDSHLSKNHLNLMNAEKHNTSVTGELALDHKLKLQEYLDSNNREEDDAKLTKANDKIKSIMLEEFRQKGHPCDDDFHSRFISKLEALMEDNFQQLKNQHKLNIEQAKAKELECVSNCDKKYRELLKVGVDRETAMSGFLQCHEKAKSLVTSELKASLPATTPNMSQCQADLHNKIQEGFEEGKKLFQSIQDNKAAQARAAEQAHIAAQARIAAKHAEAAASHAQAKAEAAARIHAANVALLNQQLQQARNRKRKNFFQKVFGW